jgi:hypothetical protein
MGGVDALPDPRRAAHAQPDADGNLTCRSNADPDGDRHGDILGRRMGRNPSSWDLKKCMYNAR